MADFLKIGELIENLTGFVKVKIELLKLEILEEVSKGIANLFALVVTLMLGMLVVGFGSITLAIFLNNQFNSEYLGFVAITGFYLLILVVTLIMTKNGKLTEMIEDQLVKKSKEIMEKEERDE